MLLLRKTSRSVVLCALMAAMVLLCSVVGAVVVSASEDFVDFGDLSVEIPESTTVTGAEFKKLHEEISDPILVLFFAPWCGSCQRLLPIWDEVEFVLSEDAEDDVSEELREVLETYKPEGGEEEPWKQIVVKVDCSVEANVPVCDEYGVNRYPTIYLFLSRDKFIEYRGERSADDLLSFVMFSNERSDGVELFTPKDPVEIAKIRHESQERSRERKEVDSSTYAAMGVHLLDPLSDDQIIEKISQGWWLIQLHIGGGYAKDMEMTFLDAAAAVKQSYPEVSIAKLNVYRRDELSDRYSIVSFPQVSLFLNGERISYVSGTRGCTFDGITGLVKEELEQTRTLAHQQEQEELQQLTEEIHS